MNWYLSFNKYAVFGGRATRAEYWYFTLFNFSAFCGLTFLDNVIGSFNADVGLDYSARLFPWSDKPTFAVSIRRSHDIDRSGRWSLIELIPSSAGLSLLIFMVHDSQPNR